VNRATGETLRQQATQEGPVPLKAWVKSALDHVICVCMNEPALEFVWVGDDAVDPLEQAQTLQILVSAGIKTREEARADLGLAPEGGAPGKPQAGLVKFNPHHDERGVRDGGQCRRTGGQAYAQAAANWRPRREQRCNGEVGCGRTRGRPDRTSGHRAAAPSSRA
jgi:hypothetical protein